MEYLTMTQCISSGELGLTIMATGPHFKRWEEVRKTLLRCFDDPRLTITTKWNHYDIKVEITAPSKEKKAETLGMVLGLMNKVIVCTNDGPEYITITKVHKIANLLYTIKLTTELNMPDSTTKVLDHLSRFAPIDHQATTISWDSQTATCSTVIAADNDAQNVGLTHKLTSLIGKRMTVVTLKQQQPGIKQLPPDPETFDRSNIDDQRMHVLIPLGKPRDEVIRELTKFGVIDHIIFKPQNDHPNVRKYYAFVRYATLSSALKALTELGLEYGPKRCSFYVPVQSSDRVNYFAKCSMCQNYVVKALQDRHVEFCNIFAQQQSASPDMTNDSSSSSTYEDAMNFDDLREELDRIQNRA